MHSGRRDPLAGLKFRRQHPIGPFSGDFACIEEHLVIELDGGHHDFQHEGAVERQSYIEDRGWRVIRFTNEEVLSDVEAVAISIAKQMGVSMIPDNLFIDIKFI